MQLIPSGTHNQVPIPPSNLLHQVSAEKVTRGMGYFKAIVLDVLTILAAGLFSFLLSRFFNGDLGIAWPLTTLVAFLILSALGMLLSQSRARRMGVVALATLSLLSAFYAVQPMFLAGVAAIVFMFFVFGEFLGRAEMENAMLFKFGKVVHPQMNRYITAIALLSVLLYLPQWDATQSFLPPSVFQDLYGTTVKYVGYAYPSVNLNSTFNNFVTTFADYQLRSNPSSASLYLSLLPPARAEMLNSATAQLADTFAQSLGQNIKPSQQMHVIFYRFMISHLSQWRDQFGTQFLFLWAVTVLSQVSPVLPSSLLKNQTKVEHHTLLMQARRL